MTYIYPDNLKAKPTLWLWTFRDIAVCGILLLLGAIFFSITKATLFLVAGAVLLFLTIRLDDCCILDFVRKAAVFFLLKNQLFKWAWTRPAIQERDVI